MSKLLTSFELCEKYRNIEPYFITFHKDISVIVGENGSGKSTMFDLLINSYKNPKTNKVYKEGATFRFLDTEKQNPRVKDLNSYNTNYFSYALHTRFKSHGEAMLPLLFAPTKENLHDSLILIDEPESGLSLKNQLRFLDGMKQAVSKGCQIIISTHSYLMISKFKEVFDMESKAWVKTSDYLSTYSNWSLK